MEVRIRKKLIEVALPLEAINRESAREKEPFTRRHPRSLHVWWSRKPLAACRAVLFAQLVDDPSADPDQFPTAESQRAERERLFRILEDILPWENVNDPVRLEAARREIAACWSEPPIVVDPFCGGGSIAVEAQRLGVPSSSSDVNPVAVLMTKAQVEIPALFCGCEPVHPAASRGLLEVSRQQARGLADDVRRYGEDLMRALQERVGTLFPDVIETNGAGRTTRRVIAWLWVRTVACPNPACGLSMPLANNWWLSRKPKRRQWLEPIVEDGVVRYEIRGGPGSPPAGTVRNKAVTCVACGTVQPLSYVREQGRTRGLGMKQVAVVAEAPRGKIYMAAGDSAASNVKIPESAPRAELPKMPRYISPPLYGMGRYVDLFTPRQLATLDALATCIEEVREAAFADAVSAGWSADVTPLASGGTGARAYGDAIATYLGLAASRWVAFFNALASWNSTNENIGAMFALQTVSMSWNFAEVSPFVGGPSLGPRIEASVAWLDDAQFSSSSDVTMRAAHRLNENDGAACVSTDPPYFDNVGYGNLADTFYVWLRSFVGHVFPDLFATVVTPKGDELLQDVVVRDGSELREDFERRLREALAQIKVVQSDDSPLTVYYAYKQTESGGVTVSTAWEAMLTSLIDSGLQITGTWPLRTERVSRARGQDSNALASSIVIVCRAKPDDAQAVATRRDFMQALSRELPEALRELQHGNIAPVDLAQAAIGPGMAIYTRYGSVIDADGTRLRVRDALRLINQVLDEVLVQQEGDFDPDTRWAVAWFHEYGFSAGGFGSAETLSKAKNTSVAGMVEAGIVESRRNRVRLLRPEELPASWDPKQDSRLTVWEATHQLVRLLDEGERAAAELASELGALADSARDLAYRLYVLCERRNRAVEARSYNGLVQSWSEIQRLAAEAGAGPSQQSLDVGW